MGTEITTDAAYKSLIEFGVVGAILAIVLFTSIGLVWWTLKTTAKAMREKDQYIQDVNERRVESAKDAVEAMTVVSGQLARLIDMVNKLVGGGGSDDSTAA